MRSWIVISVAAIASFVAIGCIAHAQTDTGGTSEPRPYELTYDWGNGIRQRIGFVYPPDVRRVLKRVFERSGLTAEPARADLPPAQLIYIAFVRRPNVTMFSDAKVIDGPVALVEPHTGNFFHQLRSNGYGQPVPRGVRAVWLSTLAADVVALDPRLNSQGVWMIAAFERSTLKAGHDVVVYYTTLDGAKIGYPQVPGSIRDVDVQRWS
jgi:hypothetical protein